MTKTLELKVTDEQLEGLKHRADQRGYSTPARLLAELARGELAKLERTQEARRDALADDLEAKGWTQQARKIREEELPVEGVELSYD